MSAKPAEKADEWGIPTAARWVPIDSLNVWESNPRLNEPAVPAVAASIKKFGFITPIVAWPSKRRIVAGHTRRLAMRLLIAEDPEFVPKGAPGPGLAPVWMHEFESEEEAEQYAIADNRTNELASWDQEGLAAVAGGWEKALAESDVFAMGFSMDEFEGLTELAATLSGEGIDPNKVPPYDPSSETFVIKIVGIKASDRDFIEAAVKTALEDTGYEVKVF